MGKVKRVGKDQNPKKKRRERGMRRLARTNKRFLSI